MKPTPFKPEAYEGLENYVRDLEGGQVWHRVFHRPLYADTDRSQVVYHSNYLRYFELGRASLMRDTGYPYKEVEDSGFVYPIIEIGLTYHKPLYYDDPMWVHTRAAELERVKIRFEYVITCGETGEIVARGFTYHCSLGPSGRPAAVDPKTIALVNSFPK